MKKWLSQLPNAFVVHWFRRDLRWQDNRALHAAMNSGHPVLPLFIFDPNILSKLNSRKDTRIQFLQAQVAKLDQRAKKHGSGLLVVHRDPAEVFQELLESGKLRGVFTNEDYEPYARMRDEAVHAALAPSIIPFQKFTDHVVQAPGTVTKPDGGPYTVFTPFSKRWKANLKDEHLDDVPSEDGLGQLVPWHAPEIPSLEDLGFSRSDMTIPELDIDVETLRNYAHQRDIPGIKGTTRISVHLRFGTISIRQAAKLGIQHSEKWLNELIWRDFYQSILMAFPQCVHAAVKPQYDRIPWRFDEEEFDAWKNGMTGYPMVDAGMRELKTTGFMHNRVRMVVASFLCKHLLMDWRLGERYFAEKLLDFELASNVGGWQWASGSGCDAAPYFRVFNPTSQLEKFDPELTYVKQWIPEWGTERYPSPIVDHKFARQRALETYKSALSQPT